MTEQSWLEIGDLNPQVWVDSKLDRVLKKIERRWFDPNNADRLAHELIGRYLAVVRKRHGLHRGRQRSECRVVERRALDTLQMFVGSTEPILARIQHALTLIPAGEAVSAREYLEQILADKDGLISASQREISQRPRRLNSLEEEILHILRRNSNLTWREVLDALERKVGDGVIEAVDKDEDGGVITYIAKRFKNKPPKIGVRSISTLPDMVGRLKRKN